MRRRHMLCAENSPRRGLSSEPGARQMRGRGAELGLSIFPALRVHRQVSSLRVGNPLSQLFFFEMVFRTEAVD